MTAKYLQMNHFQKLCRQRLKHEFQDNRNSRKTDSLFSFSILRWYNYSKYPNTQILSGRSFNENKINANA